MVVVFVKSFTIRRVLLAHCGARFVCWDSKRSAVVERGIAQFLLLRRIAPFPWKYRRAFEVSPFFSDVCVFHSTESFFFAAQDLRI